MTPEEIEVEWQLIQKAKDDLYEFGPLYYKYYDSVFGFIFNRIQDCETTSDICSKTFVKAIENLGRYQFNDNPFGRWLLIIAFNEVNQFYRKSNKNKE